MLRLQMQKSELAGDREVDCNARPQRQLIGLLGTYETKHRRMLILLQFKTYFITTCVSLAQVVLLISP